MTTRSRRSAPRSEEAAAWFGAVCAAAQQIPYGKVTSYAHLAYLVGHPERPRQVGMVMKHLPNAQASSEDGDGPAPFYHGGNVPWQRVINAKGTISPRYVFRLVFMAS
jgi:methylated-DNA-protein-cysteine methyltransferase related protein